jgi:hypothetical protein
MYTPLGGWVGVPDINAFVDGLEWAYSVRDDQKLHQQAVTFAAQYDWQVLIDEHWRPWLEQVSDELA